MFTPKNGIAMWRIIYDEIKDFTTNRVITYKELEDIIHGDVNKNRQAVYRARKQMLKEQKRFLVVERGVGFKIVEGTDIMAHASLRHESAEMQIKAASTELSGINTTKLSPDDKARLQNFMLHNATIKAAFAQTLNNIEKAHAVSQLASEFSQNEIAKLKRLIG